MTERTATFLLDPTSGRYLPANKNAIAACVILSSMRLTEKRLLDVRRLGYTPRPARNPG